jgi:hypothetical protein
MKTTSPTMTVDQGPHYMTKTIAQHVAPDPDLGQFMTQHSRVRGTILTCAVMNHDPQSRQVMKTKDDHDRGPQTGDPKSERHQKKNQEQTINDSQRCKKCIKK